MTQVWLNLPVKDISKSKEFFKKLGFGFNTNQPESDETLPLQIGNNTLMLIREDQFAKYAFIDVKDIHYSNEVLISIDAQSRDEVDTMAQLAKTAGGIVFCPPEEVMGWMYACGFSDLDGHRWNVLFMDIDKQK